MVKNCLPELEKMMQIMLLADSRELNLRCLILNFEDFKFLFDIESPTINEYMNKMNAQTPMIEQPTYLQWPNNFRKVVFTTNTSVYSNDHIKAECTKIFLKKQNKFL